VQPEPVLRGGIDRGPLPVAEQRDRLPLDTSSCALRPRLVVDPQPQVRKLSQVVTDALLERELRGPHRSVRAGAVAPVRGSEPLALDQRAPDELAKHGTAVVASPAPAGAAVVRETLPQRRLRARRHPERPHAHDARPGARVRPRLGPVEEEVDALCLSRNAALILTQGGEASEPLLEPREGSVEPLEILPPRRRLPCAFGHELSDRRTRPGGRLDRGQRQDRHGHAHGEADR